MPGLQTTTPFALGGPGYVGFNWPRTIPSGEVEFIDLEVGATSDFNKDYAPLMQTEVSSDGKSHVILPAYVPPGSVLVEVEVIGALEVTRITGLPESQRSEPRFDRFYLEVFQGRPARVTIVVKGIEPGNSAVEIRFPGLSRADPGEEPDSDNAPAITGGFVQTLEIKVIQASISTLSTASASDSTSTPTLATGSVVRATAEGEGGTLVVATSIAAGVTVLAATHAALLFFLHVAGTSRTAERRPRFQKALMWLPVKTAAFRGQMAAK